MATKQKRVRPVVDGTPWASAVRVKNSTGSAIAASKLVYFSGVTGKTPLITVADADSSDVPERTLWVTRGAIPDGSIGHVLPWKVQDGFTGLTPGAILYMNNTGSPTPNPGDKAGIIVGEILTATTVLIAPSSARASMSVSKAERVTPATTGTIASPTKTLVARDSGTTYYVVAQAGPKHCVFKLPAPAVGLNFKFIATGAAQNTTDIVVATGEDNIIAAREVTGATGGTTYVTGADYIQLDADVANVSPGDSIVIQSDGTSWFAEVWSQLNNFEAGNDSSPTGH